jgi:hypothetical protein
MVEAEDFELENADPPSSGLWGAFVAANAGRSHVHLFI